MTVITESIGEDGNGQPIVVERIIPDDIGQCECEPQAQHVYHHYDSPGPKFSTEAERNSRGWNFKASVSGCRSVGECISLLRQLRRELEAEFSPADKNKAGSDEVKGGQ